MLKRKIEQNIKHFFENQKKALLITGARQIGKTFIIRQYARETKKNFVEINFLENKSARDLFNDASSSEDIFLKLSVITDVPLEPENTIIFFDEVQECKEIVTAIKFLVEDSRFEYILSGSLLGVELKDISSVPVGYMDIYEMFPLDFEEFCVANKVSEKVIESLKESFIERKPVDSLIHDKMMELFRLYLMVGGMPDAVNTFLKTKNLKEVEEVQKGINRLYKADISKYDKDNKLYIEDIFQLIPSELNEKNKRFILKNLNENFKFSRYENSFIWLKEAGVALPVYCASEPVSPLVLSRSTNLFKLFMADVGLLASTYADGLQIKILNKEKDINFGSVYENVVAQELRAHGFDLYYYNNKRQGELDFLIEQKSSVVPIEVKSGKGYARHNALTNVLHTENYEINEGIVLCNDNISVENVSKNKKVIYYPIYMMMFIQKEVEWGDMIYDPDFSVLRS